ncbi:MAG: ARPP-1 family domain-containing protein [Rhodomicrobium sp.]
MRILMVATLAATAAAFAAFMPGKARAAGPDISGPFTHGNLAIYFVHGGNAPGPVPLTLQEAMAKGTVRVIETGSVNELRIENSGDEDVYIQSGDIVKGGRQDRVLTVSFVLPQKSGEVPVASYCVEHGRWSARGGENAALFASSAESLPSREAKLAMKAPAPAGIEPQRSGTAGQAYYAAAETSQRQRAVWDEVAKTQYKLSAGVNAPVASPASATSLQLSLENEKLTGLRAEYTKALEDKAAAGDIVGLVFAVNGRINSADIYPSNGLFRKMWAKLLTASVTEAVGERSDAPGAGAPPVEAVRDFLAGAENGKSYAQKIGTLAQQETRDAGSALFVEAARPSGEWVHRNYLAK